MKAFIHVDDGLGIVRERQEVLEASRRVRLVGIGREVGMGG